MPGAAAREHDLPAGLLFRSLEEALPRVEADFVLDVTPPAEHAVVAEAAFAAGLHVLGEKPGWHRGDAAHAVVFHFPGGLVATHVSCGCAVGSQTTWNGDWRIEGDRGSIDWERDRMWYARLHRAEERVRRELFPLPAPPPEQAILDEFLAAIREDREPECSAADNLASLAMVFAAIRSAREARRIELV